MSLMLFLALFGRHAPMKYLQSWIKPFGLRSIYGQNLLKDSHREPFDPMSHLLQAKIPKM